MLFADCSSFADAVVFEACVAVSVVSVCCRCMRYSQAQFMSLLIVIRDSVAVFACRNAVRILVHRECLWVAFCWSQCNVSRDIRCSLRRWRHRFLSSVFTLSVIVFIVAADGMFNVKLSLLITLPFCLLPENDILLSRMPVCITSWRSFRTQSFMTLRNLT